MRAVCSPSALNEIIKNIDVISKDLYFMKLNTLGQDSPRFIFSRAIYFIKDVKKKNQPSYYK